MCKERWKRLIKEQLLIKIIGLVVAALIAFISQVISNIIFGQNIARDLLSFFKSEPHHLIPLEVLTLIIICFLLYFSFRLFWKDSHSAVFRFFASLVFVISIHLVLIFFIKGDAFGERHYLGWFLFSCAVFISTRLAFSRPQIRTKYYLNLIIVLIPLFIILMYFYFLKIKHSNFRFKSGQVAIVVADFGDVIKGAGKRNERVNASLEGHILNCIDDLKVELGNKSFSSFSVMLPPDSLKGGMITRNKVSIDSLICIKRYRKKVESNFKGKEFSQMANCDLLIWSTDNPTYKEDAEEFDQFFYITFNIDTLLYRLNEKAFEITKQRRSGEKIVKPSRYFLNKLMQVSNKSYAFGNVDYISAGIWFILGLTVACDFNDLSIGFSLLEVASEAYWSALTKSVINSKNIHEIQNDRRSEKFAIRYFFLTRDILKLFYGLYEAKGASDSAGYYRHQNCLGIINKVKDPASYEGGGDQLFMPSQIVQMEAFIEMGEYHRAMEIFKFIENKIEDMPSWLVSFKDRFYLNSGLLYDSYSKEIGIQRRSTEMFFKSVRGSSRLGSSDSYGWWLLMRSVFLRWSQDLVIIDKDQYHPGELVIRCLPHITREIYFENKELIDLIGYYYKIPKIERLIKKPNN